ncbi:unnamed protein product [Tetraodon nigroviridis]|uniref:Neurochondrin n=1 Tax=Tetraodon nigroviridis TaxID=99883 RepID=Q4T380_TETNG|nr:unnamed protein product [Tetraodon nigroviridis]
MADGTVSGDPAKSEEQESGGVPDVDAGGLTGAQRELLERCLRALQQAENDSHTLAALLLITRVCPANQLDRATLKRIFEALLSLGTALLAALSTDPDMAAHPQLLASVPILLALLADGPASQRQQRRCEKPPSQSGSAHRRPAQAGDKLWSKHPAELLSVFLRLSRDFCGASSEDRLDRCARLALFLPPRGARAEDQELRGAVVCVWAALRPMLQSKLTARQMGPLLVLSACLLDLFGWELVGPPRFCCLLVNRACVEVRMGLEEPPGHRPSPEMRNTLTGCYRIMEAAVEQACCQGAPPPQGSAPSLTLQQSRQVLGVLEEAFSAQIYHLQQVDPSGYADPFVFATFRCLCSWLAEETSSLRDQVTPLLPFLIGYSRSHMQAGGSEQDVRGWMSTVSVSGESGAWTGDDALRYLLPALCHLSAEEGPRKALLGLDAQGLLVDFLSRSWTSLRAGGRVSPDRDPSMETACSVLLNVVVTEPQRVPEEPAFGVLEDLLAEALPVRGAQARAAGPGSQLLHAGAHDGQAPSGSSTRSPHLPVPFCPAWAWWWCR